MDTEVAIAGADRLERQALVHEGLELRFDGEAGAAGELVDRVLERRR